jgi:peptidoglycan/LPS O-acetylase OafA/YrhL
MIFTNKKNSSSPIHTANYFPHVDGLRALAVIGVIVYHLNPKWLPSGFAGVDVFFVISGFVVTASLASRSSEPVWKFLLAFYARRLTRIAPALLVMLLVTVLCVVLAVPAGWLTGFTEQTARFAFFGFSNYLLATNSEAYFTPRAEFNAFTHTWSLGVEEQFYLVAPVLLFGWFAAIHAQSRKRWIFFAVLLCAGLASLGFAAWAHKHAPLQAFYSLFSRFWELAVGALLFMLTQSMRGDGATSKVVRVWNHLATQWLASLFGVALLSWSYAGLNVNTFPWPSALIPAMAAALLIGGSEMTEGPIAQSTPIRRLLANRALVAIGLRSYSLYLWHWPVFVLMRWTFGLAAPIHQAAALTLTVVCAELSYRVVELPIRESGWLRARSSIVRVLIFVLAIVLCAAAAQRIFAARPQLSMSTVVRNASDWYAGDRMAGIDRIRQCNVELKHRSIGEVAVFEYLPKECARENSSRQLFVLGDSHATAYLMMFDQLAAELDISVRVYTAPGCPYVDLFAPMGSIRGDGCINQPLAAQRDVLALLRAGDIVFLPSLRLQRLGDQWARFDESMLRQYLASPEVLKLNADALLDADRWLRPFARAGAVNLFELPKPIFRSPAFRCSDWFNQSNEVCSGGLTIARKEMEQRRARTIESVSTLARRDLNISIWDPFPLLCPGGTCTALRENRPLFFDGDHVSAYGNRLLFPSFRDQVCGTLPEAERVARCH